MANYLLAYHGGGMPETEAEQARVLADWGRWYEKLGGAVVDGGNPVGRSSTLESSGAVSEGGGANPVSGYTIVTADSLDAAVDLARGCPILEGGGSIEVCETFAVM
jgi:hypothetical protein